MTQSIQLLTMTLKFSKISIYVTNRTLIREYKTFWLSSIICNKTKPEVHNLSQRRQSRTEPWPQWICKQNFVKIGPAVPEIYSRTDRQTHWETNWSQYSAPLPGRSNNAVLFRLHWKRRRSVVTESIYCLIRHIMSADLYFTRDSFFLSSFFFRRLISELAEPNSIQIGHMVGSKCNLKTHVRNLGYPFPNPPTNRWPENQLFGPTLQPNGKFNGLYLRNETWHR